MVEPVSTHQPCRMAGCAARVPPALITELLCLEHFLEQTFLRAEYALDLCQRGRSVDWYAMDWLFKVAEYSVRLLAQHSEALSPENREKTLELLLCLSNIREYVRSHAVTVSS